MKRYCRATRFFNDRWKRKPIIGLSTPIFIIYENTEALFTAKEEARYVRDVRT